MTVLAYFHSSSLTALTSIVRTKVYMELVTARELHEAYRNGKRQREERALERRRRFIEAEVPKRLEQLLTGSLRVAEKGDREVCDTYVPDDELMELMLDRLKKMGHNAWANGWRLYLGLTPYKDVC